MKSPSKVLRLRNAPLGASFDLSPRIQSMRACPHRLPVSVALQFTVVSALCCVADKSVKVLKATPPVPGTKVKTLRVALEAMWPASLVFHSVVSVPSVSGLKATISPDQSVLLKRPW